MRVRHNRLVVLLGLGVVLATYGRADAQPISAAPLYDVTAAISRLTEVKGFRGEFVSRTGRFSITLPPGHSKLFEMMEPTPVEDTSEVISQHTFVSLGKNGVAVFTYCHVRPGTDLAGEDKGLIDRIGIRMLSLSNGILEKQKIVQSGSDARRSKNHGGRHEMYVAGSVIYGVMYTFSVDSSLKPLEVDEYFASFKRTGK